MFSTRQFTSSKAQFIFDVPINQSRNNTAFTVSIEAKKELQLEYQQKIEQELLRLHQKNVNKKDIVSGHVFPIIAKDGGVLVRAGHTEASVDISKLLKKITRL